MLKRKLVTLALALAIVLSYNFNFFAKDAAETIDNKKPQLSEQAIKNYERGIESDNKGLKTSAIYIAGVYKIDGLVKALVRQLSKEKDDDVKTLIALSLYMIGDDDGIAAVEDFQNR